MTMLVGVRMMMLVIMLVIMIVVVIMVVMPVPMIVIVMCMAMLFVNEDMSFPTLDRAANHVFELHVNIFEAKTFG